MKDTRTSIALGVHGNWARTLRARVGSYANLTGHFVSLDTDGAGSPSFTLHEATPEALRALADGLVTCAMQIEADQANAYPPVPQADECQPLEVAGPSF